MEFAELINNLDADTCDRLRRALELGKWPDGRLLSRDQKELCMQAVIAFDHRHKELKQRVGYIDRGSKAETFSGSDHAETLIWRESVDESS